MGLVILIFHSFLLYDSHTLLPILQRTVSSDVIISRDRAEDQERPTRTGAVTMGDFVVVVVVCFYP